jgi:hypothetical protein
MSSSDIPDPFSKRLESLITTWLPKDEKGDVKTRSVSLYLPSKIRGGEFIRKTERAELVNGTMIFMLERFGGATQTEGIGYFKDTSKVHAERVTICQSFTEKLDEETLREIHRFANSLAGIFNQYSISVEIDGVMYFFNYREDYDELRKEMKEKGTVYGFEKYLKNSLTIPDPDMEG